MSKTTIHIGRLGIRLKGLAPETVRSMQEGLGDALLQGLTERHFQPKGQNTHVPDRIDAGTLSVPDSLGGAELKRAISDRITRTLQNHLSDSQTRRER